MEKRISENELILPALFLMELSGGSISTTVLIARLRNLMHPEGADLEILEGRRDDKFSQKVRNLSSHRTFDKLGYATYGPDEMSITDVGRTYLRSKEEGLIYLTSNNFAYSDVQNSLLDIAAHQDAKLELFDENVNIQEGAPQLRSNKVYERSQALRSYALDYFAQEGRFFCSCCSFNFNDFYGEGLGRDYIEIHHKRPVFQYQAQDINKTLRQAVENLAPVCANCHRIIHRNWNQPVPMEEIRQAVDHYGRFNAVKITRR